MAHTFDVSITKLRLDSTITLPDTVWLGDINVAFGSDTIKSIQSGLIDTFYLNIGDTITDSSTFLVNGKPVKYGSAFKTRVPFNYKQVKRFFQDVDESNLKITDSYQTFIECMWDSTYLLKRSYFWASFEYDD